MASRRMLALATMLVLTATLTAATATQSVSTLARGARSLHALDLSSRQAIESLFRARGIDPAKVVYQLGQKNYAGPSCPGEGWTCAESNAPVYQQSDDGENSFDCDPAAGGSASPDTCLIVQSTVSGTNEAECDLDSETNGAAQVCDISQDNTFGENKAEVRQKISLSSGLSQSGTQSAVVEQANAFGDNDASIEQEVKQKIGSGGPTQTQTGFLRATVDQFTSGSGDNNADVGQKLSQDESFSGKTAITQRQNASGTFLGSERALDAEIDQESDGGGGTDAKLDQRLDEKQSAKAKAAAVTQTQGQDFGGIEGEIHQDSSAVSNAEADQEELQKQSAKTSGALSQTQIGPVRCCSDQFDNPSNSFEINQKAEQSSGPGASQSQLVEGECHTSGLCEVQQKVKVQGTTTENSCVDQDCNIGIACEGTECETFSGGID